MRRILVLVVYTSCAVLTGCRSLTSVEQKAVEPEPAESTIQIVDRSSLQSTIRGIISVLEAGDYRTYILEYVDPSESRQLLSQMSLEEAVAQATQFKEGWNTLILALRDILNREPEIDPEAQRYIFRHSDVPDPIVFKKRGSRFYASE